MCACEPGYVCGQCEGTPYDPAYFDSEPPTLTADDFAQLANVAEWRADA